MNQYVFERHEQKYRVSETERKALADLFDAHLVQDQHGVSTVRSIYYDTPDYRLIRTSIEKPLYKEKLRLRSYDNGGQTAFLELKKKYHGVVYKRRAEVSEADMNLFLSGQASLPESQIFHEIEYFCSYYGTLRPSVLISYDRQAYTDSGGTDLRVTLDSNIRWQTKHVTLRETSSGTLLLAPGEAVLEIKASHAMPLWLAEWLSRQGIRQSSFSKYGYLYQTVLCSHH